MIPQLVVLVQPKWTCTFGVQPHGFETSTIAFAGFQQLSLAVLLADKIGGKREQ